jgi:hypothetical protein
MMISDCFPPLRQQDDEGDDNMDGEENTEEFFAKSQKSVPKTKRARKSRYQLYIS